MAASSHQRSQIPVTRAPGSGQMPALSLYQRPSCSYCVQVRSAAERMGIALELRDIRQEPRWREELVAARGRATVPVLRIDGPGGTTHWLPESLDIIRYLKELTEQPDPVPRWVDRLMPPLWMISWVLIIAGLVIDGGAGTALLAAGSIGLVAVVARRIAAVMSARQT
jgi:glutathione S-transferase